MRDERTLLGVHTPPHRFERAGLQPAPSSGPGFAHLASPPHPAAFAFCGTAFLPLRHPRSSFFAAAPDSTALFPAAFLSPVSGAALAASSRSPALFHPFFFFFFAAPFFQATPLRLPLLLAFFLFPFTSSLFYCTRCNLRWFQGRSMRTEEVRFVRSTRNASRGASAPCRARPRFFVPLRGRDLEPRAQPRSTILDFRYHRPMCPLQRLSRGTRASSAERNVAVRCSVVPTCVSPAQHWTLRVATAVAPGDEKLDEFVRRCAHRAASEPCAESKTFGDPFFSPQEPDAQTHSIAWASNGGREACKC